MSKTAMYDKTKNVVVMLVGLPTLCLTLSCASFTHMQMSHSRNISQGEVSDQVVCPADEDYICYRIMIDFLADEDRGNLTVADCIVKSEYSITNSLLCDELSRVIATEFQDSATSYTINSCKEAGCERDNCNKATVKEILAKSGALSAASAFKSSKIICSILLTSLFWSIFLTSIS